MKKTTANATVSETDHLRKKLDALDSALKNDKSFRPADIDPLLAGKPEALRRREAQTAALFDERKSRLQLGLGSLKWLHLLSGTPSRLSQGLDHLTELYVAIIEFRASIGAFYLPSLLSGPAVSKTHAELSHICAEAERASIEYLRAGSEKLRHLS